jgi:dTDP-4-amino-4,6-dideoxygalactose transaminase
MDALQAAVLNHRLDHLDAVITRRREIASRYQQLLSSREEIFVPPCRQEEFNTFHTFVIQCDRRNELQQHLSACGIQTAIHYPKPIHLQPAACELGHKVGDFPVTEELAERILTLPVNQYVSDADVDRIAAEIQQFYAN